MRRLPANERGPALRAVTPLSPAISARLAQASACRAAGRKRLVRLRAQGTEQQSGDWASDWAEDADDTKQYPDITMLTEQERVRLRDLDGVELAEFGVMSRRCTHLQLVMHARRAGRVLYCCDRLFSGDAHRTSDAQRGCI